MPQRQSPLHPISKERTEKLRLALFEPDIPQNCGAILRLGACLGVAIDIIEPCGFLLDDKRMKRAGLDYIPAALWQRHGSWQAFRDAEPGRLVLLTTGASTSYVDFAFEAGDILLFGRESAGVPDAVHRAADQRLRIPMVAGRRSINVAQSAAMVLGEALRQIKGFPLPKP